LDPSWVSSLAHASQYFMMGAVSPDMPYLDVLGGETAKAWADCMHLRNVAERIRAGVAAVVDLPPASQGKALAWLLGFVEHVVFDVYMHPIVNSIAGGVYSSETKDKHAECEMHQDAYIVKNEFGIRDVLDGDIVSNMLSGANLHFVEDAIDPDIETVWKAMLLESCPDLYRKKEPDIGGWYRAFRQIMEILEGADGLVSVARHIAGSKLYPKFKKINVAFTDQIETPSGEKMKYDMLFDAARWKVVDCWKEIATAVVRGQKIDCHAMSGWNLDSGQDGDGKFVFWS
jgi:hypothetical protein